MANNEQSKYQQMEHTEHILELPDTYVGSSKSEEKELFIFDEENNKFVKKNVNYVPALY